MDAVAAAWDSDAFVALLGKLVGEAKHLQNGAGATPTEDRGALESSPCARRILTHARAAARHVLDALQPHSTAQGGPLIVRSVSYVEGRSNIIVELRGSDASAGAVSFVGMHLDVVPANPGARDTPCCALLGAATEALAPQTTGHFRLSSSRRRATSSAGAVSRTAWATSRW